MTIETKRFWTFFGMKTKSIRLEGHDTLDAANLRYAAVRGSDSCSVMGICDRPVQQKMVKASLEVWYPRATVVLG